MLVIDGSQGEGGGQIVRTCLSLSMITKTPFRLEKIRAGRAKPGLRKQHLTAIEAAATLSCAQVVGNQLNSRRLTFEPGEADAEPGNYFFDIGTAGSTTLVLQTILYELLNQKGQSTLRLKGGTHNPFAPTADFLISSFIPAVNLFGPEIKVTVPKYGFYPRGGGELIVEIKPRKGLSPVHFERDRQNKPLVQARILLAHLPEHIAEREARVLKEKLRSSIAVEVIQTKNSMSPGNCIHIYADAGITAQSESGENISKAIPPVECFVGLGRKGLSAENVSEETSRQCLRYLNSGAAIGEYLADQLLLPMALAGRGSYTTFTPSMHTRTNIETIEKFLPVRFKTEKIEDDLHRISVEQK